MFRIALLVSLVSMAFAMPAPGPTRTLQARQVTPTFAIEDGKISAGLILNSHVGKNPGASATGYLSIGGDLNLSNGLEGAIQEGDTESIPLFGLGTLTIANGAPGATGPVSATANLAGVLSESGLLGQVGGTLLGVPLTVGGGVVSAGLNLGSLQGTVVPTGVVQVGQEGASGVVAGGLAPTGGHISASGGFTLGPLAGHAFAQGGVGKYGPYFEGATLEGILAGETIEIPLPSLGFSPPAAKAQATRTFQTVRARQTLN